MADKKKQMEYEEEEEQKEETLATPGVVDKYKAAAKIANSVLEKVIQKCTPGANIVEICQYGDQEIESQLSKVYGKVEKGIAFPVCISVNEICGHFSPLATEGSNLNEEDLAKIDLGVHIDGYIALVAHTIKVTKGDEKISGKQAEVILAAWNAFQAAIRLLKPGNKNSDITKTISKISSEFECNPVEGVISHELKKHLIDGNNVIINKETYDQKVEEHEIQVNEVYGLDIIVSTGEGKPKEGEIRTTVYKRAIEKNYNLKTKAARQFYNELIHKFPATCFTMRAFEDEITTKIGVKESIEHDLLVPYPILFEKQGEYVAQFKSTILVLQGGTQVLTGLPLDMNKVQCEKSIKDQSLIDLLNVSMNKNAQKTQKKKAKKTESPQN